MLGVVASTLARAVIIVVIRVVANISATAVDMYYILLHVGRVLASISATNVNVLYSSGWSSSESISYSCRHILHSIR